MKKKVLIIFMSACSLGYAQLGVNTTEITSTLTVQGSISANYREIENATYAIQKDDYNISYLGKIRDGLFFLPSIEGFGDSFGRMYNIKNLSSEQNLVVRTSGTQTLQFGGKYPKNTIEFTIYPGQHLYVIANKENNWTVYDYASYAQKTVAIDNSIAENSVIRLGNFSFRIVQSDIPSTGDMNLEIKSHQNYADYMISKVSLASENKVNNKTEFRNTFVFLSLRSHEWQTLHGRVSKETPALNLRYVQSLENIITIYTTGETYRVTCYLFNGTYASKKKIVIKVERLE